MSDNSLVPQIAVSADIGLDEIAAVKAHQIEVKLRGLASALDQKRKDLRKEDKSLRKTITKMIHEATIALWAGQISAANSALAALDINTELKVGNVGYQERDDGTYECWAEMVTSNKGDLVFGHYRQNAKWQTWDTPENIQQQIDRINAISDEFEDIVERAAQANEALRNLPSLERQMRAKVAEHNLGLTEEGRSILKLLEEEDQPINLVGVNLSLPS